jgi:hypothetical protein
VQTQLSHSLGAVVLLIASGSLLIAAEKNQASGPSARSTESGDGFLLRYQFDPGESIRYQVTHVAKTKTRIRGAEEVSHVHTVSEKLWEISAVTAEGEMTFVHSVQSVEMMQQAGESEEIRWDSRSGATPPVIFQTVAQQLNTPLSTVTINPRGQETHREKHAGTDANLGMGGLTLPLPDERIAIGYSWSVPREIKARAESGEVKVVKARDTYTLEKVQTGVATLKIRSEVLTPMDEAAVKAQIVQQLSNGSIRFDIDSGRVLSKQLDWDETVVGFQGHNSLMEYRARVTEQLIDGPVRSARR